MGSVIIRGQLVWIRNVIQLLSTGDVLSNSHEQLLHSAYADLYGWWPYNQSLSKGLHIRSTARLRTGKSSPTLLEKTQTSEKRCERCSNGNELSWKQFVFYIFHLIARKDKWTGNANLKIMPWNNKTFFSVCLLKVVEQLVVFYFPVGLEQGRRWKGGEA